VIQTKNKCAIFVVLVLAIPISGCLHLSRTSAVAPQQPEIGPGGADYLHATVAKSQHGHGGDRYWLFKPAEPTPGITPLLVLLHGWAELNPQPYGAWIEHLVRRGNIVIFPVYQDNMLTSPNQFTAHAANAIRDAISVLQREDSVTPDLDRFGLVGHSVGGIIAANLAARAVNENIPPVRVVMCANPGISAIVPFADLGGMPAETLLLTIAGDEDRIVGKTDAQNIYNRTTQVPCEKKAFLLLRSDYHGKPTLNADHAAPMARDNSYDSGVMEADATGRKPPLLTLHLPWHDKPNSLDYYGYWRLFDALCEVGFKGDCLDHVLDGRPIQAGLLDMGTWDDGVAVTKILVVGQKNED